MTITANFQERNLGTALSGKKMRPMGRIVKSWAEHERVISQSNSRIEESGPLRCLRKKNCHQYSRACGE